MEVWQLHRVKTSTLQVGDQGVSFALGEAYYADERGEITLPGAPRKPEIRRSFEIIDITGDRITVRRDDGEETTYGPIDQLPDVLRIKPLACSICHREVHPWWTRRPKACAPRQWLYCIREADDPAVVHAGSETGL